MDKQEIDKPIEDLSRRNFIKKAGIVALGGVCAASLLSSCGTELDPQVENQYSKSIYPIPTDTQQSGSEIYRWLEVHTKELWVNGIQVGSGIPVAAVNIYTDTQTLDTTNYIVICNKATAMTINLPAATGSKKLYEIENKGLGVVTVDGNGADTIDGESTQELSQYEAITIVDYAAGLWAIY